MSFRHTRLAHPGPAMLEIARRRAAELGRRIELAEGNAHELGFADASFDTVVCTFSLCNIPDERTALVEMYRVLRPGRAGGSERFPRWWRPAARSGPEYAARPEPCRCRRR
ncbi:MAG: class I SAM-dependent methyltransferase [Pseudonocardia sp.]|nr:class I SAM-dependent methyltransferase [Pseudonocardia sp.]